MSRYRCPDGFRMHIFNRDHWRCRRCGKNVSWEQGTLSHKLSATCGGMWIDENIDLLCLPCHIWVEHHPTKASEEGWRILGKIIVKYGQVTFYGIDEILHRNWRTAVQKWAAQLDMI